ncbi:aldose 1-epimerase [Polaribacter vadi]|uniref:aldose 1-epimerase n=1 Tax=Polaribacter TaxID=52959 RepID=UPI001C0A561B|nr:aldose 1-epimerase [Polaribacter sp. 1_MG-2023]MBU3010524.1 aldose 1-epimerase [Polaribacter vadi]MDO6740332.1 aldose 1-epimerase [Polaribacter sp. 1_MG-2023]
MFKINTITENGMSFIELQNSTRTTTAKICLDQGARLQELKFNDVYLIKEQPDFDYASSYASSILFPFASRVKEGKYKFLGQELELDCNDAGKSALHGLVYNKKFNLFEPEEHKKTCFATFNYYEKELNKGFPFTYIFSVTYTLFEDYLKINVTVKNTDEKAFPFTLGWHPYFNCSDFETSYLSFKSDKKVKFDENLITKEVFDEKTPETFKIDTKQIDDCFVLNDNIIQFTTPDYKVEMSQRSANNFLQLYKPKDIPVIAIEPTTGISNSFNNKIGLQVLESGRTHSINWNLKIIN